MFMMGTAMFLDSLLGFVAAATLIPYFMLKARFEERQLRMRFTGYLAYRATVHRWLIPFVL
jgi:protein-S-isoprenylcysteine O-methyltransferase Ste14